MVLSLPVSDATGDDVWCSCIVCGRPYDDPAAGKTGQPVEHLVKVREMAATTWRGLHSKCWERNR
jgi:hypothetical protein